MKKINLRELYPDVYITDFFVDVTEEVMETIRAAERAEAAYERKMYGQIKMALTKKFTIMYVVGIGWSGVSIVNIRRC